MENTGMESIENEICEKQVLSAHQKVLIRGGASNSYPASSSTAGTESTSLFWTDDTTTNDIIRNRSASRHVTPVK